MVYWNALSPESRAPHSIYPSQVVVVCCTNPIYGAPEIPICIAFDDAYQDALGVTPRPRLPELSRRIPSVVVLLPTYMNDRLVLPPPVVL